MKSIFLQTLYDLPNATTGIDDIGVQIVTEVNSFIPLLLLFVFFVVFLGGVNKQKARTGTADYAAWSTIGSIAMLMISLIMSTISGLINLTYLVIVVVITIFSGVWLFLDRKPSEV